MTEGIYIYRQVLKAEKPYTFAISRYCFSVCCIPILMFIHIKGNTIKKDITTGTKSVRIHKSTMILKEATGVAFITCIAGEKN